MLTFLGFAMVITFMFLIMTKRLSALIALIIIPIIFALFGGFSPKIGPMMLEGITKLAPTGVMLMFAILYFALRSEEHTSELQSQFHLVCRLLLEKKKKININTYT